VSAQRIAIIGSSGQLGSALANVLHDRTVIAPAHAELALEDTAGIARLLDEQRVDVLVNCAAFHQVDACETQPNRAFAINALAVDAAAQACAERDIAFATISSDYVFDGTLGRAYTEADAPNPRTAYGISKLAGELLARRHGPRHLIVRTSGLFGASGSSNKGPALIERVLDQARRGEPTRMVEDVIFSPSYAPHVARALRDLIDAEAYGTHHLANAGQCSWYEFVRTAFARAGLAGAPLEPITYAALGNRTQRPLYSPLENTTLAATGVAAMPRWQDALDAYLDARSLVREPPAASARRAGTA
jgi:dTDP-4-dehydrorhamnose reductase